ncbi:HD-GYP domain-containing protein [Streptomyces roseolilacinus]|uniref:Lipoprotein n=1 Tax=Streptomyces roseolilacinus TaxID=66904 RepID=A0A918EIX3_9ACTN|nr:HD domain-containing protein [Streptomyces roseolilacinus]GGP88259.1 lipoprotein [Streptomyces roseolilacinus]
MSVPCAVAWVWGCALGVVAGGVAWTLRDGVHQPGAALAFGTLIAFGGLARWHTGPGEREPAPLGAAGALAYALVPAGHGVPQVVAVAVTGALAGAVPHVARGRGPDPDYMARRVLTLAFVAVCAGPLHTVPDPGRIPLLLLLLVLTALCDAVLAALLLHARTGHPYTPLLHDELRALPGIGSAVRATGAVMALAVTVAGLWALPVVCVPLLLTQLAFRRYAAVRRTYRQTIASLARATEVAGYTPPGHAHRVAALSRAVGRELGLSGEELTVLEYAALMHDIGQLSLVDPVPEGATAPLPAAEQRRIALLGGAVARQTGVPAAVAVVVERQADPYREQPLAARIVRAVNAYDDLSGETAQGALRALEHLRLGTARDYHPAVVESLVRVVARGGVEGPVPG